MPPHGAFRARQRFGSLDGLRCASVLAVIWHHAGGHHEGPLGLGFLGVDLFFAISGFLITTLLLREHAATGRIDLRRFYVRRSLRIFPLYFAVLGLYVLLVAGTGRAATPEGAAFLHDVPAFATYTSNWFVGADAGEHTIFYFAWSLATEEQFYLVWAPLLLILMARGRVRSAAIVLTGLVVIDQLASRAGGTGLGLTVLRSVATPICLGALWALALHSPAGFRVAARMIGGRWAAPAVTAALAAAVVLVAPVELIDVLLAALVAVCCVRDDHALAPLLGARPVVFLGTISYGMYLLHMLAVNAVRPALGAHAGVGVFAGAVVVTVALAAASHRWFEGPILRYKARFSVLPAGAARRPAEPAEPAPMPPAALRTPARRAAA